MKNKFTAVAIVVFLFFGVLPTTAAVKIASPAVAAGYNHSVGLNSYGRVYAAGDNSCGQCDTVTWQNVVGVAAGMFFSAALFADGTVSVAGTGNGTDTFNTSDWDNIVKIVAGDSFLAGLSSDGSVFVTGKTTDNEYTLDTSAFGEVTDIAAGAAHLIALRGDGTCVGTGKARPSDVSAWTGVNKIFAGANVSAALLSDGTLIYAGFPRTTIVSDEESAVWAGSSWTDIDSLIFVKTTSLQAVTVGIKTDGTYITDDSDGYAALDFSDISNAKQIAVGRNPVYLYSLILNEDSTLTVRGLDRKILSHRTWLEDMESWRLDDEPLDFYRPVPLAACGRYTAAFALHTGELRIVGKAVELAGELPELSDIVFLDSTISGKDTYIAIDENERVFSNSSAFDFSSWRGVKKLSVTRLHGSNVVLGLRWDRKAYSTNPEDKILTLHDIKDVAGGNYYSAALTEDGKVSTFFHGSYSFQTSDWTDIAFIAPGYSHLVGVKTDGTAVVAGGSSAYSGHDVSGWTDIKEAACGHDFSVGLKSDGTCLYSGTKSIDVSAWRGVSKIYAGYDYVIGYIGDGKFLFSGNETYISASDAETALVTFEAIKSALSTPERLVIELKSKYFSPAAVNRLFLAVYDKSGNIVSVKTRDASDLSDSLEVVADSLPDEAQTWKVLIWNTTKPFYYKEGTVK